jgi:Lon protease-like protein
LLEKLSQQKGLTQSGHWRYRFALIRTMPVSSVSATNLLPVDWLRALAVFPLPRVVFFPGTVLPLHIFEPRYRALMRDCLRAGQKAMAVTLLKPGYEANYEGRPAMHEVCTIGRIEQHEELPDGRFNLLLRGVGRVRLNELPPEGLPYRRASVELLDGKLHTDRVTRDALTTLLSTASLVGTTVRRSHPDFSLGVQPDDPPHQVADTLADRLLADPEVRQDVLETLDVPERIRRVTGYVAALLGQLESQHASRGPVQ